PWLPYIRGLAALHRGQLVEALHHATASVQRAKDSGHQKMMWRSDVLRAFVLAECLRGEEAVAQMPPVSRRSDAQDMIYDATPRRVRFRLWFAASGRLPTRRRKGAPTHLGCVRLWTACRPRGRRSPCPEWPRRAAAWPSPRAASRTAGGSWRAR